MMRYPLKGRLSHKITRSPKIVVKQPFVKDQKRPSLKGRVQALPKNAFWHRVGSWPLVEEEKFVV
jgi:hypothetical protein